MAKRYCIDFFDREGKLIGFITVVANTCFQAVPQADERRPKGAARMCVTDNTSAYHPILLDIAIGPGVTD